MLRRSNQFSNWISINNNNKAVGKEDVVNSKCLHYRPKIGLGCHESMA